MRRRTDGGEGCILQVNVIGLGYIGLPTALMFAAHGVKVVGTDIDAARVTALGAGCLPFEEKGLPALFDRALAGGIRFSTAYHAADVYIIAVPTPYDKRSKRIEASAVVQAVGGVLAICPEGAVLVVESTVSPGTMDRHVRPLIDASEKAVHLVHAPERIIPGNMVHELVHNARTIGADDPAVGERVKALYRAFCTGEITVTGIRVAEMTKVVENTFRDVNIAYANELVKICRMADVDAYEVIRIANKHPRVDILRPGPGVGGHCISVDPWFLVGDYPGLANLILAARKINDSMPEYVLARVHDIMREKGLRDVTRVGFYGLTYKEDVDDVRESPTLQLLALMQRHLATGVKVYDPMVRESIVPGQMHDLDAFLSAVDLVVVMVGHREILESQQKLSTKAVLDTRHALSLEGMYFL